MELYVGHWLFQMWELQISSDFQTAMADVTGYAKSGKTWVIKYHFRVSGDITTYSAQNINFRDTWVSITDAAYDQIQQQDGKIQVQYLPHDPWLNQPVGARDTPIEQGLQSWICLVPFNLMGLAELCIVMRNYLRCRGAAEQRAALKVRFWESKNGALYGYEG